MLSLFQTKAIADTNVQSVLSNIGFVPLVVEIIGRKVDRGVEEYRLIDVEEA